MASKQAASGHDEMVTAAPTLTAGGIAALAAAAGLPLTPQRIAVVQPILAVWLADSVALNTLMQAEAYRDVAPITMLRHGVDDAGSAE